MTTFRIWLADQHFTLDEIWGTMPQPPLAHMNLVVYCGKLYHRFEMKITLDLDLMPLFTFQRTFWEKH